MKKILIYSILLVCAISVLSINQAWAISITKDTSGSLGQDVSSGSITVGSNNNRLLVVEVATERTGATPSGTVSSITYNGVNLSHLSGADGTQSNTFGQHTEIWYLIAPTTGTHNIVITMTSTNAYSYMLGAYSLYNVKQS